jgi:hypothetical protein
MFIIRISDIRNTIKDPYYPLTVNLWSTFREGNMHYRGDLVPV